MTDKEQVEFLGKVNTILDRFRGDTRRFWLCSGLTRARFTHMEDVPFAYAYCDILSIEPEPRFFRHTCGLIQLHTQSHRFTDRELASYLNDQMCWAYENAVEHALRSGYAPIPPQLEPTYRGMGCREEPLDWEPE